MTDFVSKPFSLETIEACLKRCFAGEACEAEPPTNAANDIVRDSHASASPLLDPSVLYSVRQILSVGDDLIWRIVALYVEHAPATLEQLRAMQDAETPGNIAECAHALKSLSRNVGATRVGDIADDIESCARDEGRRPSPEQLMQLVQALDQTLAALKQTNGQQESAA